MTYEFRPAKREKCALLIALAGPSGSGKTWTALALASGLAGAGKIALIDTEARRALHYARAFNFSHLDLRPPFRPSNYADAIAAADAEGFAVIIVDSMSHEHAGQGGILDWHDEELTRMAGDDYRKREACKFAAWIKPKVAHKQMIGRLLQTRAHLIFCLRAEPKMEMVKNDRGKLEPLSKGFQPICDSQFMYEMTLSMLLSADAPGVPMPIKLQEQHKACVDLTKPITRAVGEGLASWARGGETPKAAPASVPRNVKADAYIAASGGNDSFQSFWKALNAAGRNQIRGCLDDLKDACSIADSVVDEAPDQDDRPPEDVPAGGNEQPPVEPPPGEVPHDPETGEILTKPQRAAAAMTQAADKINLRIEIETKETEAALREWEVQQRDFLMTLSTDARADFALAVAARRQELRAAKDTPS